MTPLSIARAGAALSFILVAAIWGCTNPLLKKGSDTTKPLALAERTDNAMLKSFSLVIATLLNWRFSVPFLINQAGSLVYFYLLGSTDISMAVPICNSLTFVFTGELGLKLLLPRVRLTKTYQSHKFCRHNGPATG